MLSSTKYILGENKKKEQNLQIKRFLEKTIIGPPAKTLKEKNVTVIINYAWTMGINRDSTQPCKTYDSKKQNHEVNLWNWIVQILKFS